MPCPSAQAMTRPVRIFPRSCTARGAHHRASPADRTAPARLTWAASSRSNAPAWDTTPRPSADTVILGWPTVFFTRKVSSPRRGQDLRQALSSQAKVIFKCKRSRLADHRLRGVPTGVPGPAFPNSRLRTDPGNPLTAAGGLRPTVFDLRVLGDIIEVASADEALQIRADFYPDEPVPQRSVAVLRELFG
jgi:hypothetical protein